MNNNLELIEKTIEYFHNQIEDAKAFMHDYMYLYALIKYDKRPGDIIKTKYGTFKIDGFCYPYLKGIRVDKKCSESLRTQVLSEFSIGNVFDKYVRGHNEKIPV
jgi:hypothetical protein